MFRVYKRLKLWEWDMYTYKSGGGWRMLEAQLHDDVSFFFLWLGMVWCLAVNILGRFALTWMPRVVLGNNVMTYKCMWTSVLVMGYDVYVIFCCICDTFKYFGNSEGDPEDSRRKLRNPDSHWLILPLVLMLYLPHPVDLMWLLLVLQILLSFTHSLQMAAELLWRLQDELWLLPPLEKKEHQAS